MGDLVILLGVAFTGALGYYAFSRWDRYQKELKRKKRYLRPWGR